MISTGSNSSLHNDRAQVIADQIRKRHTKEVVQTKETLAAEWVQRIVDIEARLNVLEMHLKQDQADNANQEASDIEQRITALLQAFEARIASAESSAGEAGEFMQDVAGNIAELSAATMNYAREQHGRLQILERKFQELPRELAKMREQQGRRMRA